MTIGPVRWWLGALFMSAELVFVATHLTEARALARQVYVTTWKMMPNPDHVPPPDRFLTRHN